MEGGRWKEEDSEGYTGLIIPGVPGFPYESQEPGVPGFRQELFVLPILQTIIFVCPSFPRG